MHYLAFMRHCLLLTKISAEQNEVALSHHRVHALCLLAVIFAATNAVKSLLSPVKTLILFAD